MCVYTHPNIYFCFSHSGTSDGTVAGRPKAIGYISKDTMGVVQTRGVLIIRKTL